ncbi:MAG TPA: FtsX-like permease family protein [Bryobacteraceae bacterium]
MDKRDSLDLAMIARLSEGQSREQARASLVAAASHIGAEFAPDNPRFGKAWEIQGIRDIDQVRSKQGNVLILFSILLVALVGLVIFIACANVAGLLLVRGVTRSREIAIRLAIGAGRWHIVRQLLTEGIVLAALGCVSGILIWRTAAIFFENVELPIPVPLVFQISTNSRMLLCAFALGAVCTVLSSLGPALQAAKSRFLPALKSEQSNLGNRHLTLRNILVVSQISICFVLLISAILFFRTINRAKEVKTGFDVNHTITVRLREPKASFRVRDGVEQLASIPGVRFASAADRIPLTFTSMATVVHLEGKPESAQFEVRQSNVMPGYFRTMGIPLLRGKDFRPSETGTVIVNQLFAERHFPDGNAIGHRIVYGVAPHTWTFEIKAIVANTKYFSLAEDQQEIIYLPLSDEQDTLYLFASMAAPANTTADSIRKKLRDWAPTALIEVHTLRDNLYVTLLPIQIGCTLLTIVGGIGLCLALVGFYSVLSYAVARKTKEIGAVASLGLAKPLQAILGTNSSYSLWAFSVSVVILLGVCFATALLPAYRAVHIDPLRAIQYE